MDFYRHLYLKQEPAPITYALVYLASIIFTFQALVTAYSSSTYMERFVSAETVGLLYSIGAAFAIAVTLILPRILRQLGNVATMLALVLAITVSLVLLGGAYTASLTVIAFIAYLALTPQVFLNIDIFLETLIGKNEGGTGRQRGLILTLMAGAALVSPLAMGYIIGPENNLERVYYVGAAVGLLLTMLIIARFRHFSDPVYETVRLRDMLQQAYQNSDIRIVLSAQFLLQFFYTWAVIYIPLYLATVIGFDWQTISLIIAAGLLAFVIFEYPIGFLADRHFGEKEMMALGFVILALTMASASFFVTYGVVAWMILMFISRIGASLVEVTTESYFFKKVNNRQSTLISFFRLTRPLANLLGALVGSISLFFLPFPFIFLVLAAFMAAGVFFTSFLTDTR